MREDDEDDDEEEEEEDGRADADDALKAAAPCVAPPFGAGGVNAELRNRATTVAPAQPNACPPTDERKREMRGDEIEGVR